jgi:hypothetical protein
MRRVPDGPELGQKVEQNYSTRSIICKAKGAVAGGQAGDGHCQCVEQTVMQVIPGENDFPEVVAVLPAVAGSFASKMPPKWASTRGMRSRI